MDVQSRHDAYVAAVKAHGAALAALEQARSNEAAAEVVVIDARDRMAEVRSKLLAIEPE